MPRVQTHDGLTLVIAGWPYAEFAENRKDIEGHYLKAIELAPAFAERLRRATRQARFAGAAVPNYFRKPYGRGWVLVGDAGYNRDFITAQGILDAFRDAELCAAALDRFFSGGQSFENAMAEYHRTRDARWRRCTGSHASWRRSSLHRPTCSNCSPPHTAIKAPWTASRG